MAITTLREARSHTADTSAQDPALQLLLPEDDLTSPECSIVIPALNEELTIGDFVDWCYRGLADAGGRHSHHRQFH